jgi:hypothetical protein
MLWLLLACSGGPDAPDAPPNTPTAAAPASWANVAPARVLEAVHGDGRSYLRVEEAAYTFWVSVPRLDVAVGDFVNLGTGSLHEKLHSAELSRDFTLITEIDRAEKASAAAATAVLTPVEGGVSIGDLYARRAELSGKPVTVRGRVVKASKGIFDKNWYHLRDGTGAEDQNDLTVTTRFDAELGDVLVAEAPLTLDRDLGFGYFFPVILEDATVRRDGDAPAAGAPTPGPSPASTAPAAPAPPSEVVPVVAKPRTAGLPPSPTRSVFGVDIGLTPQAALDAWATSRALTCATAASPRRATTHTTCTGKIAPTVLEGRKVQGIIHQILFSRRDDGPIHSVSATTRYSLPASAAEDYTWARERLEETFGKPSMERPFDDERLEQKLVRFAAEWHFADLDVVVALYRTGTDYYTLSETWAVPGVEGAVEAREGSLGHGSGPLRPPGWNPHVTP